jgi:hypothetical protein
MRMRIDPKQAALKATSAVAAATARRDGAGGAGAATVALRGGRRSDGAQSRVPLRMTSAT